MISDVFQNSIKRAYLYWIMTWNGLIMLTVLYRFNPDVASRLPNYFIAEWL